MMRKLKFIDCIEIRNDEFFGIDADKYFGNEKEAFKFFESTPEYNSNKEYCLTQAENGGWNVWELQ